MWRQVKYRLDLFCKPCLHPCMAYTPPAYARLDLLCIVEISSEVLQVLHLKR